MRHSDQKILNILEEQGMEQRTEYTITNPDDFLHEMRVVRAQGYSLDDCECELDGRCIGAPIYDRTGSVIAAISVSGLSIRFSAAHIKNKIVPHLLKQTLCISRKMGYNG